MGSPRCIEVAWLLVANNALVCYYLVSVKRAYPCAYLDIYGLDEKKMLNITDFSVGIPLGNKAD